MPAIHRNTFTQQDQENKLNQFRRKAQRYVAFLFNKIQNIQIYNSATAKKQKNNNEALMIFSCIPH